MIQIELKKDIYYVGVQNPNLRIFDIIMETKYGTSYNSYLVKGSEKTALIETAHARFFDQYLDNITDVAEVASIDYIVLNHTEPDHTGSLARLLEMNPNITVVSSMAGNKYAKSIANIDFKAQIVKDGDSIDLGGKTLKFVIAPFLHWPDSMFTYIPEDKVLFPCDMFGCHYCEPKVLDTFVAYPDKYDDALLYYYTAIFGPFKPYVLSGMDKIKGLELDMVCPSHGPVLTESIQTVMDKYRAWSTPAAHDKKKALILYVSAYGCTGAMAETIGKTLEQCGDFAVEMYDVIHHDIAMLKQKLDDADLLFIGSPTINRDALKPIWDVLSVIDAITNKGKTVGVFGSYGWSGEAVPMVVSRLQGLKMNVVGEGIRVNFVPSQEELSAVADYAKEAAKLVG